MTAFGPHADCSGFPNLGNLRPNHAGKNIFATEAGMLLKTNGKKTMNSVPPGMYQKTNDLYDFSRFSGDILENTADGSKSLLVRLRNYGVFGEISTIFGLNLHFASAPEGVTVSTKPAAANWESLTLRRSGH